MNTATNNHIAPILITWARVLVGAYLIWLPQQDGVGMVAGQPVHLPYLGSLFGVPAFHKNHSPHQKPEPLRCHVGASHLLHSKQQSQDCGIKTTRASLLIYGGGTLCAALQALPRQCRCIRDGCRCTIQY